ncbi:MAG: serine/threonine protein kinase, partial [Myxococcota bacterium]
LTRDEQGRELVKLLDFGAVQADLPLRADGARTTPGMLIGTLTRMSPEQLQGERVDLRTDVWALGLLAYEAVVGRPVIHPELSMGEIVTSICGGCLSAPSYARPELPRALDAWFAKSTAEDPNDRFASVREQVEALLALDRSPEHRPTIPSERDACAVVVERNPHVIEVDAPVRSFPQLVQRGALEAGTPALLSDARPAPSPRPRCTWPAPARMPMCKRDDERPDAADGSRPTSLVAPACMTLLPPGQWPS